MDFLKDGQGVMREAFESTCQMAARIAHRLGMPDAVQDALMNVFEEWDGRGMPQGRRGDSIPIISRIVLVTSYREIFHSIGGREAAQRLARERKGKAFDPSVVDAFLSLGQEEFWKELEHERVWETVLSLEPDESPHKYVGEEKLTDVALCFADYADVKSPYMLGHSRRVADLTERLARRMLFPESRIADIYRAALVHDVGLVAVPSFALNQPRERLTEAAVEQIRLHPYSAERILSRVPAFHAIIPSVAAHHERLDGQGYHRGLPGAQIPPAAQIIAVADSFDELTHDQADQPALEVDEALGIMRQEAGSRLGPDAFRALAEDIRGLPPPARQRVRQHEWPAGLTDREVEVLRAVAKGLNRQEAAKALFVSEGTVRSHLEHIYAKIGVSNRSAATLFAIEHDLLP
jgi:HD-GYP domain-containing protein (c-di-GMP phosphodiesterase class II)